jgi:glucose-1-phosphate adenylyltransferase
MVSKKIFGIVLAGGEGKRLMPLTADRAKPAVPFGGVYRLVDFALSNLVNSGLRQIVVLTQYKSHSLDRHVSTTWLMSGMLGSYIASVPAQQRLGKRWFSGSADAILQSLNLLRDEKPDIVVVVGADHVYRMDFTAMIEAHIASGMGVTVAAIRQPIALADQFGVIELDPKNPEKIAAFREKPKDAIGLADSPNEVLASMGNYVFDADVLREVVTIDAGDESSAHDLGGDLIPALVKSGEAHVYDFTTNEVPGETRRDRHYWRDVGTLDSYYDAHMDLVAPFPVFNLYNEKWAVHTQNRTLAPAKIVEDGEFGMAQVANTLVCAGAIVSGATVRRSVLSPGVRVEGGAIVEGSILLDDVWIGRGAVVRNAIIDKNVVIPDGMHVGVDLDRERSRFVVSPGGVTAVAKGRPVED